ncbi:MAG: hypothetical protein DMG09_22695 [Acidobacteria bacterium]|nr:MAG: hypothetical protein DMG09_22695 [Acidobacteriota bacterium]
MHARRLVSGQAQRDKFRRQIGAPGRDDDELLAVQHVGHRGPLTAQQLRATHEDVRRQIDALLDEYTDAQVARILNESGLRTGAGDVFDTASVQWVRYSTKLKSLKERLLDGGMITKKQLSAMLGVCRTTIGKLRRQGRLKARICNDQGEWLYWPPEQISPLAASPAESTEPRVTSTAGDAV